MMLPNVAPPGNGFRNLSQDLTSNITILTTRLTKTYNHWNGTSKPVEVGLEELEGWKSRDQNLSSIPLTQL